MSWANLRRGEHNHTCPKCQDYWKCGSRICQAPELDKCLGCRFKEFVLALEKDPGAQEKLWKTKEKADGKPRGR